MRTRALKRRDGFTLTELVIAMSLSSLVLIGLMSVATAIVRAHVNAIKHGEANGTTLYALHQMNREIEQATHIESNFPPAGALNTAGSNIIKGCVNWSRYVNGNTSATSGGGRINTDTGDPNYQTPYWFAYCVKAEAADVGGRPQNTLYRHQGTPDNVTGCPNISALPATCGTAGAGETVSAVVFQRFYPNPDLGGGTNVFARVGGAGTRAIRVAYMVGTDQSVPSDPSPTNYKIDTTVIPEKASISAND